MKKIAFILTLVLFVSAVSVSAPVSAHEEDLPHADADKAIPSTREGGSAAGEVQPSQAKPVAQHNETNLEFITERASPVSVNAIEVRGWDPEKKEEFLGTVKGHAQLQSEQDLENFATGILLRDENIKSTTVEDGKVEVAYKMPAKFLGIFQTRLAARASAESQAGEEIGTEEYGRVKIKFPWYRFLYRVPEGVQQEQLEQRLRTQIENAETVQLQNEAQRQARLLETISAVLKSSHDTAINSIRNFK